MICNWWEAFGYGFGGAFVAEVIRWAHFLGKWGRKPPTGPFLFYIPVFLLLFALAGAFAAKCKCDYWFLCGFLGLTFTATFAVFISMGGKGGD